MCLLLRDLNRLLTSLQKKLKDLGEKTSDDEEDEDEDEDEEDDEDEDEDEEDANGPRDSDVD
jgi:Sec-independent protein translocase protein TatA